MPKNSRRAETRKYGKALRAKKARSVSKVALNVEWHTRENHRPSPATKLAWATQVKSRKEKATGWMPPVTAPRNQTAPRARMPNRTLKMLPHHFDQRIS